MDSEETHFVELRHNSDMNFIFQIASDPERLTLYLAALFQCVAYTYAGTKLLIKEAKKIIAKLKVENNSSNSDEKTSNIINNYYYIVNNPNIISKEKIENISYNIINVNNVEQIQSAYININKSIKNCD